MNRYWAALLSLLLALCGCDRVIHVRYVSPIELIADPIFHHLQKIIVIGYFYADGNRSVLCDSRESYERNLQTNCVIVSHSRSRNVNPADWKRFDKKYVIISGRFEADLLYRLTPYKGTIGSVDRLQEWLSRADYDRAIRDELAKLPRQSD